MRVGQGLALVRMTRRYAGQKTAVLLQLAVVGVVVGVGD